MSIYVGGERAKLYRGDYCPAQLYKGGVKIAGYTNVEKVGTSISGVDTYNDALLPTIEGKSAQTVTANSPSPDYPSPIRSSEEFDVVSCGRNLFDKRIYNGLVTYTADGFTYPNKEMPRIHSIPIPIDFKPNTQYTMSCDAKDSASTGNAIIAALFTDGSYQYLITIRSNVITHYSKTTFPNRTVKSIKISYAKSSTPTVITINHLQIEEGVIETPYEPYYHATTAHVTDPLRSVGDVHDTIEVSDGKVELVKRVENRRLTASDIEIFNPDSYKNVTYFSISKTSDDINIGAYKNAIPLLCEFAQFSDYRPSGFDSNTQVDKICTGGNNFYLVGFPHGTPETQGKAKLENTNYLYVLKTPTRTDITATPLGQALLAMRTYPHYTQVYTNATLPPTLRAKIKEMVL